MDLVSSPAGHNPPPEHPGRPDLPELAGDPASGDRISVTDARGTIARFEMAYSPGPSTSRFYRWIVEGDRGRPLSAQTLSFIVLASAIGTLIRAHMRGVVVRADGVEARYLLAMGLPRIRRWAWSQIERIVLDDSQVMFELWNGQYERLPRVRDPAKLGDLLERIASARRIRLTRLPSGH
jgi:hypothetical protein